MKIRDNHLLNQLDELIDIMRKLPEKKYDRNKRQYSIEKEEAVSKEYLKNMQERCLKSFPHNGPPDHHLGSDLILGAERVHFDAIKRLVDGLGTHMSANRNALISFYPPGGFIAWHHNADVPGRNILFTWSETGEGSFNYYNDVTGTDVNIPDVPGWSAKSLYYFGHKNAKKTGYSWHSAETTCNRFTIAFVLTRSHWDISSQDSSHFSDDLPHDFLPKHTLEMFEDEFDIEEDKIYDKGMFL